MAEILQSEALQKEVVQKGMARIAEYEWARMAEETLEVYKAASQNLVSFGAL